MILFFVHDLDETDVFLEEDEFQHCIKVLRKQAGETITVTDGKGTFAEAQIDAVFKRKARLAIISKETHKQKPNKTILAVAPPKSKSRWEWILEKTVEAGVDLIIPFESTHSERVRINFERAKKIMRSAALQSKRVVHPDIGDMRSFRDILHWPEKENTDLLLAHFDPAHSHINTVILGHSSQMILIGPEGDFSPEEYAVAADAGFTPVNLSRHRLRTETAAFAAVCLLEGRHYAQS